MNLLRFERLKRGWSQERLAQLVDSNQPTIAHYELGHRKPTDHMLGKLADVLGVSPAFLLLRPVVVHQHATIEGSDQEVA